MWVLGAGTARKRVRVKLGKRGVLGAGQVKKGGLYRGTYLY